MLDLGFAEMVVIGGASILLLGQSLVVDTVNAARKERPP